MKVPVTTRLAASLFACLVFTAASRVHAQKFDESQRKEIHARRVNPAAPKIDGRLDDEAWKHADFVSDFKEKEPNEGAQPSVKTEVAILYDADALYVGARMYCDHPESLRMHLDRRDQQGPAEQFIVSIDSYLDRRTAYGFGINTSGVRFDRYNPQDSEQPRDFSYNPVWEGRTARDDKSWTAEMRIPFSQLRFTDKPKQVWGINFNRWRPAQFEDIFWVYVPRNGTGWASRFGNLVGIEGIKPSRRLELLPYTAGEAKLQSGDFSKDPYHDGSDQTGRVGGDVKMGLGPNLTLDATVNPDFGQVEADPAEVNLSSFETYFDERRPFFTEGSQLFTGAFPSYFYSRRIGAPPHGFTTGDFVDGPQNTTILGAGKVTGRLQSGTSVGLLSGVTQREYASEFDTATQATTRTAIEPATGYGVARIQQEFGASQSTAGVILVGTARDLQHGTRLDSLLRRNALAGGADWNLRFRGGQYELEGYAGFSQIRGSKTSILDAQLASARYYQRPDINYVHVDPNRTSLTGYTTSLQFSKRAGKHWLGQVGYSSESPGFELNDAGILQSSDDIDAWGYIGYQETDPASFYHSYLIRLVGNANWNYGGTRQWSEVGVYGNIQWRSFWNTWLEIDHQITGQDDSRTRGGPSMQNEAGYSVSTGFSSPYSGTAQVSGRFIAGYDELGGWVYIINGSVSTRVGTHVSLSASPFYRIEDQPRQYVTTVTGAGGGAGTFGARYIFSHIDRSTLSMQLRASYFFTPDLSLDVYAEPFAASGRYHDHGELVQSGGHDLRVYGNTPGTSIRDTTGNAYAVTDNGQTFTIPNLDFGWRSFRSNMVLRWEFNPGSTLYLVWQRNLGENQDIGRRVRPFSPFDAFTARGEDFFALKIAYWLPVS